METGPNSCHWRSVQLPAEKALSWWSGNAIILLRKMMALLAKEKAGGLRSATKIPVQARTIKQSKILDSVLTVYDNFSVNGGWSEYEVHVSCSVTCGAGQKTLQRYCNNPTPAYGGANCVGNRISTADCNLQECPGKQESHDTKKQMNLICFSEWRLVRFCCAKAMFCHMWQRTEDSQEDLHQPVTCIWRNRVHGFSSFNS